MMSIHINLHQTMSIYTDISWTIFVSCSFKFNDTHLYRSIWCQFDWIYVKWRPLISTYSVTQKFPNRCQQVKDLYLDSGKWKQLRKTIIFQKFISRFLISLFSRFSTFEIKFEVVWVNFFRWSTRVWISDYCEFLNCRKCRNYGKCRKWKAIGEEIRGRIHPICKFQL